MMRGDDVIVVIGMHVNDVTLGEVGVGEMRIRAKLEHEIEPHSRFFCTKNHLMTSLFRV